MAKVLTAGYVPMGAVVTRSEIIDALPMLRHVQTFMGHAVAAAAANTVIGIIEREGLIERSRLEGASLLASLRQALEHCPVVGEVRGVGLWLAIEFTKDKRSKELVDDDMVKAVVRRMREHGVLAVASGQAIEVAPPLISTRSDLDTLVAVAERAIGEVTAEQNAR